MVMRGGILQRKKKKRKKSADLGGVFSSGLLGAADAHEGRGDKILVGCGGK